MNLLGSLHGGAIATIADIATTITLNAYTINPVLNVSLTLTTNYLKPATLG